MSKFYKRLLEQSIPKKRQLKILEKPKKTQQSLESFKMIEINSLNHPNEPKKINPIPKTS